MSTTSTHFTAINALWDEFLARWPMESLRSMSLEEYSQAGSKDCFTYWLETLGVGIACSVGITGRRVCPLGSLKRCLGVRDQLEMLSAISLKWCPPSREIRT